MDTSPSGAGTHKVPGAWALVMGLAVAVGGIVPASRALAQAGLPASAASDAPSESLRRQALSPYRFILQHANVPARGKQPAAATEAKADPKPEARAEPKAEPRRPAPPVEQAAVQPVAPAAAAPVRAPVAEPAPEPVAAVAPRPAEPPPVAAVRREIVPVRTDEPRLSAALLRERPSGIVKVSFEVRPDGSTGDVKVVSSTNRALNRASVEAIAGWKFEPIDEATIVETELAYKYE